MSKNKFWRTPRGDFQIEKTFQTENEANAEEYYYYFTYNGFDVYIRHIDVYHCEFALIANGR